MTITQHSPLETVGPLPNGYTLYREPNGVGGYRYWSDEIGGGVVVWDTSLCSVSTILAAVVEEQRREREAVRVERAARALEIANAL